MRRGGWAPRSAQTECARRNDNKGHTWQKGPLICLVQYIGLGYQAHYHTSGEGHVYQGRFKSFPVQDDGHFLTVCRYVERNALRAELVARAEDWRWGSLWRWLQPAESDPALLSAWPIPRLPNWVEKVNEPLTERELAAVRRSAQRGRPLGKPAWVESTAQRLGLASTLRPRGEPQVRFLEEFANNES